MKDAMFFIFIILCLSASAIVGDNGNHFFPCRKATLSYISNNRENGKNYLRQTIYQVEKKDSGYITSSTLTVLDRKQQPLTRITSITTEIRPEKVIFQPFYLLSLKDTARLTLSGKGLEIPLPLNGNVQLKDGYLNVSSSYLRRGFHITKRHILQEELLNTPAGSFHCFKENAHLEIIWQGLTKRYHLTTWYAQEVGVVRSEVKTPDGKLISSQELIHIDYN